MNLRELFDQYISSGYDTVKCAVDERWQESGVLDFKAAEKDCGPMTDKDRIILAKALSGFANSEGGLIIWGIDARKGKDGVDEVQGEKPISCLKRFISSLDDLSPQVVSPAIIGVEHYPIFLSDDDDKGFVITYVPKGQDEPHMAVAKEQNCYFYRSNNSFLRMQSFMVADRYSRRPQPKLEFHYSIGGGWRTGSKVNKRIHIGIHNTGLGVALFPAIRIIDYRNTKLAMYGLDGNGKNGLTKRLSSASSQEVFFTGGANDVVHPHTILEVTSFEYIYDSDATVSCHPDVYIAFELFCDGFHSSGDVTILAKDLCSQQL